MMINTNALRGPYENLEDPNASQSDNKPELQINGALLAKINEIIATRKDQELFQLLKEKRVNDRLEACLLYYKLEEGNADTIEQAVSALNTKFAKKEPLSDNMKEMVLKPFALACSLQANAAFEILDAFFMVDYRKFYHFEQVNQRISDFMRQISQTQGGNFAIQMQQRQQLYEAYHQELQQVAAMIVAAVKSFYLQERANLLRCLVNLLGFMSRSSSPPQIRDFFTNKLVQKDLSVNLAKSLLRCQVSFNNEFRRYFDSDSSKAAQEALALAIQEEQIELLKLLFSIFYTYDEVINTSVIDTVIQYLVQSCQINYQTAYAMSHLPQFIANDSIIASLTQLVCFTMLKLHHNLLKKGVKKPVITPQTPHAWNLLMNPENLSLVTGPIVLAVLSDTLSNDDVVQKMKKNLEDARILVATTDLLRSEAFRSNKLYSMNDAFYLVIYGWLNRAHRFFESAQLAIEVDQVQMLTLSVLGKPSIVKLIWSELDDLQSNMNDVSKKIEIFKKFLENPTLDSQKFLMLMLVLSGKKDEAKGTSVMELLQNTKTNAQGADSNLLIELIAYLYSQMSPLEQKRLDQDEYSMMESVLILFAKVIKQDPLQYARLNRICRQVAQMQQDKLLGFIFEKSTKLKQRGIKISPQNQELGHIELEPGNHPFLSLLVRAFHSLMLVNFQYSRKPVVHLMDAITSLYDSKELFLKQDIMFQLNGYVNHEIGGSMIVSYFGSIVLDEEYSLKNYKATESFLRFLSKVVKSSYPQECLHPEGLQNFDQSIIIHALRQTYFKCMSQYFNVAFTDAASMGTFTARCLKLTRTLLNHFLEVPQSQKAPLCEPIPRFDMFLQFVTELLDQFSVENICIKALELVQIEERRPDGSVLTQFENKFLNEARETRQVNPNSTKKLIKMTNEALLVLNMLLKLALVDDSPSNTPNKSCGSSGSYLANSSQIVQDWSSKRCKYVRDLKCVQQFRLQILDPTHVIRSAQSKTYGHAVNLSLQSIVGYYICPGVRLENLQMKTNAVNHLTLTCKLWQQSHVEFLRPDLHQLLQGLGSPTQLEQLFFQQLALAFINQLWTLPLCLAFLDLLIVSAQSQPSFLEMLLKEEQSKQRALTKLCESIVAIIKNRDARQDVLQDQQKLHIKFKFTVLLSLLAKKRLCIEFVNYKDGAFLQCVMQHIIEEECLERVMQEKIQLNGKFLHPVIELDEEYQEKSAIFSLKTRQATNQCIAKVIVCSFLQLLISEFSRDPTQATVRALITRIFTNESFTALSLSNGQISSDVHQLMNLTRNLNELLQTDQERNTDLQRRNHDIILGRGIASLQDQSASPLYSRHNSVFLKGSLCIDLFQVMEKKQLPDFVVNPGADLLDVKSSFGHLGCSLYVSTKELEYVMHQEFYENKMLIAQATALSSEFNLALSVMLTDHMVLNAKQDFMISVGKIALRDSQSHAKSEQLVPMSFLPLINKEVALSTNQDTFNKFSTQLSMNMIKQAQSILAQIQQRRRSISLQEQKQNMGFHQVLPQNYFLTRLDQALLTQLVFTLGVISSQVSAVTDILQVNIKADLQKLVQHDILMQIQNLVDLEDGQFDSAMISQELSVAGRFGDQTAAIDTVKASTAIQMSERERYDLFIQLVTQCFQLCIRLKQDEFLKQGGLRFQPNSSSGDPVNRAQVLERQRLDDAYIKVLAQVLNGMRRNQCFLKGVKVFVLAVQLIDEDGHRGGLCSLMKKQEDQPMKVIISKLLEKDVSQDEITTILQLLINYAMTKEGAIHMSKIQILESLFKANIMQRLNEQDLYVSKQLKNQQGQTSMQQVRNPSHVHWCQVLILIRTLNETLLENPQVEHENYFTDLVIQMHHFKQRIPKVLHIGLQLEAQAMQQTDQLGCRSILSMALLEEIELLCGVMQQVFEHADYWAQLDFNAYAELKDYTLFAMSKLLQHCNTASIIPASVTEQHLAKVNHSLLENNQTNLMPGNLVDSHSSGISGFELKAEICLQKIFLSVTCSLLNILLLCKKLVQQGKISALPGRVDLLDTWHQYSQKNFFQQSTIHSSFYGKQTSGVFSEAWMNGQLDSQIITVAFEVVRACQERMMHRYAIIRTFYEKKEVQSLYKYLQNLFHHDEWIMNEYSGGFNAHMFADVNSVEDLLDLTETALQVSAQVSALLLEKVRENTSEIRFDYSTYTDEQQVVFMANDLIKHLKDIDREVKDSGPQTVSIGNQPDENKDKQALDGDYLDKLLQYVQLVKKEPGVGGVRNRIQ